MKIILTTHQFLPDFSAGTEILTYGSARELKLRGHDVEVWTGYPADVKTAKEKAFDHYEYDRIPVHRYYHNFQAFPHRNILEYEYNNPIFSARFKEYLEKARPDIVHFFHLMRFSGSAIDACLDSGIPMVFTPTDFWIICMTCQLRLPDNSLCTGPEPDGVNCIRHIVSESLRGPVWGFVPKLPRLFFNTLTSGARKPWWPDRRYSPMLKALADRKKFLIERANRLNRVIVPTRFMEKLLVQNGLNPGITSFIPFGLDLKPFEGLPTKNNDQRLRVGFIGTLCEHKGAHLLIEAVKLLPENIPMDVRIYGKLDDYPAYSEKLKRIADGERRIEFCGTFPNDQIGKVFSTLDVLVVPSIWYENTPLVIYSAFAAKTPVIATNLGGMSEVVHHEKNGLLFEKGDAKGLSLLLKRCVEDRSLLERLASNITPPLSIEGYVDRLEEVYGEVLEKRRKRA